MNRRRENGLFFLMKRLLDEKEDYRVRLYILAWIATMCAMLALVIGALILLFKAFELLSFISIPVIPSSFPG